jgi:hypothetical protein
MVKHFLKTLVIFMAMIGMGLIGVYLVNYLNPPVSSDNPPLVAK